MSCKEKYYPEARFGGFPDSDTTVTFYVRVNALIEPSFTVLDFGCGTGFTPEQSNFKRNLINMRGKVARVIGVDVDPRAEENNKIDEFYLIDESTSLSSIDDGAVDLIYCDWVLEHIKNPDKFFYESSRVLKTGGKLCIRTSNKWSYVAILSRLIPERYHKSILSKIQSNRRTEDIFPSYYACNTIPLIRKKLRESGFDGIAYGKMAHPSYLEFSCFVYGLGVLFHKLAPRIFAHTIMVFAENAK